MFNGSFLRVCRILRFVKKKIRFCLLESGWTKPWCPGLVSWPRAKAQEPLARSRGQWQEVDGLLFNTKNSQLVHILFFHSYGVVSLFIFPTGPTALDYEPRGRRYVKNTGHGRVPKHRNQWQEVDGSGKKQRACYLAPKTISVGAYFELSFLGCGFLIHLSNRSDSPQF